MSLLLATCDASLLLLAAVAAWSDARTGLIPNVLTLPMLSIAPLAHFALGGPGALLFSLLAALTCALVPLVMFLRRAMGGGDVKLFAAIGALAGIRAGIEIQLLAYVIGAGLAVVGLWRRGALAPMLRRVFALLLRPFVRAAERPVLSDAEPPVQRLGVPVLLACLWVLGSRWLLPAGAP